MKNISENSSIQELILQHPSLMAVLYLTGIRGSLDGKTIGQICKYKSINVSFVLNLIDVYTSEKFVLAETLPSYSILQLSDILSAIYPHFLNQFDNLIPDIQKVHHKLVSQNRKSQARKDWFLLESLFLEYRQLLSDRFIEQEQTVLPHIKTIYELYYCPDYTSERSDILNYSLEFYKDNETLIGKVFEKIKHQLELILELKSDDLKCFNKVYAFYQLNNAISAQDRMEQKLLKPLILQMEESIITTFHAKKKKFQRNTYLPLPKESLSSDVLSSREKEVLQLVAQGFLNKEIADKLHIGLTTVISHRKNIVNKLGIKTVPGLTVYAYRQGYLDKSILIYED
jgi:DNA-binding CsgD family transcriptional regulator